MDIFYSNNFSIYIYKTLIIIHIYIYMLLINSEFYFCQIKNRKLTKSDRIRFIILNLIFMFLYFLKTYISKITYCMCV